MGIRDLGLFQDLYQFVCGYIIYAFIAQNGNNVFFDKAMITFVIIKGMTPEGLEFFYGTFKDKIIISANSVHSSPIQIFGTVIDDMRKVSTATAPRMKCSQSYFNLGNISLKKHIQRKVKVTNEGANPLIIRKIECPEFVSTNIRGEKVLKQNECLEVLFELNVSSSNHLLDAKVKLITNDAHQPVHTVIFEGEIGK